MLSDGAAGVVWTQKMFCMHRIYMLILVIPATYHNGMPHNRIHVFAWAHTLTFTGSKDPADVYIDAVGVSGAVAEAGEGLIKVET